MAKNEKKVQNMILGDLRALGRYCEVFKIMKTSDAGIPDIFFTTVLTGPVLIEAKKLKGTLQEIQKLKIAKLNDCGARTFVCHSIQEWVDIKKKLKLTLDAVKAARICSKMSVW